MRQKNPLHFNYNTRSNSRTFIGLFRFPISGHAWSEHGTLITKTDYPNFVVARNSFRLTNKLLYLPFTGVSTLTNAVSGQSQNCSGNLEISQGIGTLGNFSGKQAIIQGHCIV